MKAAVMRANDAPLSFEDVRHDEAGPGEVLVKSCPCSRWVAFE